MSTKGLMPITEPVFRIPIEVFGFFPNGEADYKVRTSTGFLYIEAPSQGQALDEICSLAGYWENFNKIPEEDQGFIRPFKLGQGEIILEEPCSLRYKNEQGAYLCSARTECFDCGEPSCLFEQESFKGCYLEGCPAPDFPGCPYFEQENT